MGQPAGRNEMNAVDSIQERLVAYSCSLSYDELPPEVVHAAKVRIIDTLGALFGGFFSEPCRIARSLAAQMPDSNGSTVIGTRTKTAPDMAAFVNGIASRYVEMNDTYHWPGSAGGHASDVVAALLTVAEHARVSGREFITSVVLAYEIYLRISDIFRGKGFDQTTFCGLAVAVGAARMLGLGRDQMAHCISMSVLPNNILAQVRTGHLSMWKAVATGQASRTGVFAALLARAGMQGPHLPFEGKAGWCDHVAENRFSLDVMGGNGTPFKILDTLIKRRASCGTTISSIFAAEKVPLLKNIKDIDKVTVEVYKFAKEFVGSGEHRWNPDSRETADHSIPYVVAAALMDGTVTARSFDDAHLWNPELRALMQKIEVVENQEFSRVYDALPVEHHTRITVSTVNGKQLVGKTGGGDDDISAQPTDAEIEAKFRMLSEDFLGAKQVNTVLARLWDLENLDDVAAVPPMLILA